VTGGPPISGVSARPSLQITDNPLLACYSLESDTACASGALL